MVFGERAFTKSDSVSPVSHAVSCSPPKITEFEFHENCAVLHETVATTVKSIMYWSQADCFDMTANVCIFGAR